MQVWLADLKFVKSCAKQIAQYSKSDKIVVEKSTLPVRTTKIKEILTVNANSKVKFEVLSNPEFLAEGTAIQDLFKSDRVLIEVMIQTESGNKGDIIDGFLLKDIKIMFGHLNCQNLHLMQSNISSIQSFAL